MQFIIEAITRQDNLALLRFRGAYAMPGIPGGEFCLWNGKEGITAAPVGDLDGVRQENMTVEWGYTRILFDGIGMHRLAGQVYALLEEYPVTAVSVSDIRLGILVPAADADAVWLAIWARFGSTLSEDSRILSP